VPGAFSNLGWVARRVVLCACCTAVCVLGVATALAHGEVAAGSSTSLLSDAPLGSGVQVSPLLAGEQVALRQALLESPLAVEERAASRTRYEGLARAGVLTLAEGVFSVQRPRWSPPSSTEEPITSYLGEDTATVSAGGKHLLMASSVPLRSAVGSGRLEPTSLALREQGGAFVPANPVLPVSIAKDPAGGVSLPAGVSIAPSQAGAPESPVVVGDQVLFPNTALGTDYMVEPVPAGVEMSWLLTSARSSEENALQFTLPAGASLRLSSGGGAEVLEQGVAVGYVPPATATEADGVVLPVSYTVSGDRLITHVDLAGSVAFPVLVDPAYTDSEGYGNYGAGTWGGWVTAADCSECYGWNESAGELGVVIGVGDWTVDDRGEWWFSAPGGLASEGGAGIVRVDIDGLSHESAESAAFVELTGSDGPEPGWTFNGEHVIEGLSPYVSVAPLSNDAMAMCAQQGGGTEKEGDLCNYNDDARSFRFGNIVEEAATVAQSTRISGARVLYLQETPPVAVELQGYDKHGWSQYGPTSLHVRAHDQGVGIQNVKIQIPAGHENKGESYFFQGFPCNATEGTVCPNEVTSSASVSLAGEPTGVSNVGVYASNAVGLEREEEVNANGEEHHDAEDHETVYHPTLYIDHTPPAQTGLTGSLAEANGQVISSGSYTLHFSAEDGSTSAPQSGMRSLRVLVDGSQVAQVGTFCAEPTGVPASSCYALSGSWTMEGRKYGAGLHTVKVIATDWMGNESAQSVSVTVNEAPSQAVGPGSVNLKTGAYTLGAQDVAVASPGGALSVARSYNSRQLTGAEGGVGPLGLGWNLSLPDSSADGVWQSLKAMPNGSVQATTAAGAVVTFVPEGSGFAAPAGYQTVTLTEPSKSPLEYKITDSAGNATNFVRVSGSEEEAPLLMPNAIVQATGAGGLNKMSYVFTKTAEGVVEPKEVIAPYPSSINCLTELVQGCRALEFVYATATTSEGENESQWKEYKGRLVEIKLVAWSTKTGAMTKTPVAKYAYDLQGRLRAQWNPEVPGPLKTIYGYDAAGHVTAVTPPGQETWAIIYGTTATDSNTGRFLKVTRAQTTSAVWAGAALTSTAAPVLKGTPREGARMAVSPGGWSGGPVNYGYAWEDCNSTGGECTRILGADSPNYTPATSDVGHYIVAQVTATSGAGSVTASSGPSAIVTKVVQSEYTTAGKTVGVTDGPEGDLWFTSTNGYVGKMTPEGKSLAEYKAGGEPEGITTGSDKKLWFANPKSDSIGTVGTSGAITSYTLKRAGAAPSSIVSGPGENLWFTETEGAHIGEMNTKGEVLAEYATFSGGSPRGIAVDTSGNLWFAEYLGDRICKMTSTGALAGYKLPAESDPDDVVLGPDGKLWFVDTGTNAIGTMTTSGTKLAEYSLPQGSAPRNITVGPEKDLWFTDSKSGMIGKITTAGLVTEIAAPAGSGPASIAVGPESTLWYTTANASKLEKFTPLATGEAEPIAPVAGATVEYNVPLDGAGLSNMTPSGVALWGQSSDLPGEGTAIFAPDEPENWPAGDYRRASIFYLDASQRTVDLATPAGGVTSSEYDTHDDTTRTLSADNRATALAAGAKSAETAKPLYTERKYNSEGTELQETLGPEHKVKLPAGSEVEARKQVKYTYNEEGAPAGGPYRLVTQTTEDALTGGKEEDKRSVANSYSGQEGFGWKLHEPTSTTVASGGLSLLHSTLYNSTTGAATETVMPGNASKEATGFGYVGPIGSAGTGSGQLSAPTGDAIDAQGDVWVADSANNRLEEFTATGVFVKAVGFGVSNGEEKLETCTTGCKAGIAGLNLGQLSSPEGVAIAGGDIYVASYGASHLEVYNEKGEYVNHIGDKGTTGGKFAGPTAIAAAPSGNIWVADTPNYRLQELTSSGTFVEAIGWGVNNGESKFQTCTVASSCKAGLSGSGKGQFANTHSIAFVGSNFYVTDATNDTVTEFNEAGEPVSVFGAKGKGAVQFEGAGAIAKNPVSGNLDVSDLGDNRVEVLTTSGTYVSQFGSTGNGAGQLKKPEGIAVSSAGVVYVSDGENNRVAEWAPSLTGNTGSYTSQIVYYTPKTEASVAVCQNHPEWASLPCQTQPSHQPEVAGTPPIPVTTYTYNIWDEPEVTKSTSTEGGVEATRTAKDGYEASGRLLSRETTSSSGTALPKVTYTYSSATGLPAGEATSEGAIGEEYNNVGQLASYTNAQKKITTYEYEPEKDDRLLKTTDERGYQSLGYSETTGLVSSLQDSGAGTFNATYDPEGNLVSESMPNALVATTTRNSAGEPTSLAYVKQNTCSEHCNWLTDTVTPSIHGQWASQETTLATSTLDSQSYSYNEAGWLAQVQETPGGGKCATRLYGYNADGDRTSLTRRPPASGGGCGTEGGEVEEHAYDTTDRLLDAGTAYNPFGDITSLPAEDAGGTGPLTSSFYTDGQLAAQEQGGQSNSYKLDPARRTSETVATGHTTSTFDDEYDGPGSAPSWLYYPISGEWTRDIFGIAGTLTATQTETETPVIQLSNLHGDTIATVPDTETATGITSALETSEYGVPTSSEPPAHAWLGSSGLRTELASGALDMGARSYVPQLGRFLQPDPQAGGSGNAYSYTHGDPLNESDPSGEWSEEGSSGGLSAVGHGEGVHLEGGVGVGAGAVSPPPPNLQAEAAFAAAPPWDQVTAGAEEYEEWEEEESGYEWASYSHDAESGEEEAHAEPAILVQPLGEAGANEVRSESGTSSGSIVPLCKSGAAEPCADEAGGVGGHCHNECKGHPKGYYVHNQGNVCFGIATTAYIFPGVGEAISAVRGIAGALFLGACG
jgi:RHS repeat-associated protein